MKKSIALLKDIRQLASKSMNSFSREQLLTIPQGFNNNLLWNFGHLVVVQQALLYKLSGLDMYVTDEFFSDFMKASSPSDWDETPDIDTVKRLLTELPDKLESDFDAGKFTKFNDYMTSAGIRLQTIEDAILFNNFHEGVHMGTIMSLKKLVI